MMANILTILIFFPVLAAFFLFLFFRSGKATMWGAFIASIIELVLTMPLMTNFDKSNPGMQFVEKYDWISSFGIQYYVGVDGISILMVFLTTLLTAIAILGSFTYIQKRQREFYIAMLILEAAMVGVFVALDFFLFYILWEAMLIPMYLIIGVWGGARRIYAAVKFFLYTLAGSVFMMLAIIALYFKHGSITGNYTFDILAISSQSYGGGLFETLVFLAFFVGFAIKVPMFPVHTWLPDAHVEAPTAGSVILAGVLLKMGTYGLLRFCLPITPIASINFMPFVAILSVIAIIYGALVAMVQEDIKKLVAYSSVSHMGFVTLGIYAFNQSGIEGGILQMFNHGIITGALFLLIGLLYERTHTRMIADYGGIASKVPVYATIFLIFTMGSIGLPSMGGFIGEFLVLVGSFKAFSNMAIIAASGVIFAAVYMLWMYQRVFFQSYNTGLHNLTDMNVREVIYIMPLIILVFWTGIYPETFTSYMHESVKQLVEQIQSIKVAMN
ncbi:MAG: NADH-quinone oxidoreductase subunit M [Deferribacterales bacterium]|jgi:NADH-quinone oxidoreductase subunit M|uniref:NADH-quinone oxidoreductase subunit M n=1 Tax=Deferrivibrio essentukiensis TaxID=2880922 RepID=UPI0019CD0C40|nr:NADH-quinone oxidoreductase subunit M [Deferrivibrio essentukiensis]MBC7195674.1 NADH-quinone oxidoreductase subunit M [Deferribacterales bacterium]MBZ4643285.1 proton-translocating NADH-quinone oxidoreductase, chain [Deferribacteraceae bacterium]MCB4203687.1 NADH-quinone oxidoreductase subunit M [Deferrivibrio essentukiensis]MDK2792530.1 NADH-quinone oxidoreductase subunit [Deferribacteres bacterium]